MDAAQPTGPLGSLEEWDEDVRRRYPEQTGFNATDPNKKHDEFRDYEKDARPTVREFYRQNHQYQTFDFVQAKRAEYLPLTKKNMGIWEALEFLNTLIDDSDPDTDLAQIEHCLQTAEAIRKEGKPDWFVLTGLIHDLGKILCLFGEPQWAVVGDTFPVGCRYSERIVFPKFFSANPDYHVDRYQTKLGVYEEGAGLDSVTMSWGHDEYLYHVTKEYLPVPAQYMIRYHSFYAAHRERDYEYLMNDQDKEMFDWVRAFNPFDLYTKSQDRPNVAELRPVYEEMIAKYFPATLRW